MKFGVEAREASLGLQDVLGMDEDIGRLPLESAERLMDVEAGIGERRALARLMEAGASFNLRLFLPDLNELSRHTRRVLRHSDQGVHS